jgi:hypothetical protein
LLPLREGDRADEALLAHQLHRLLGRERIRLTQLNAQQRNIRCQGDGDARLVLDKGVQHQNDQALLRHAVGHLQNNVRGALELRPPRIEQLRRFAPVKLADLRERLPHLEAGATCVRGDYREGSPRPAQQAEPELLQLSRRK